MIPLFQDWIGSNLAMGRNSINGRTFTSETIEGFADRTRFMGVSRVRDVLNRLVGTEVLDKISVPARTERMLGYVFQDKENFLPDW